MNKSSIVNLKFDDALDEIISLILAATPYDHPLVAYSSKPTYYIDKERVIYNLFDYNPIINRAEDIVVSIGLTQKYIFNLGYIILYKNDGVDFKTPEERVFAYMRAKPLYKMMAILLTYKESLETASENRELVPTDLSM